MIELIVHSHIFNGDELVHNVQSDNLARLKQARRALVDAGYEVRDGVRSARGYHALVLWSREDRAYTTVPRAEHSAVLRVLRISVHNVQRPVRSIVISTYARVRTSRNMKNRRPSSPVRM